VNEPLFPIEHPQPARPQLCDRCLTAAELTDDGLRVLGWIVYDGRSFTGKELHVRICPACK